MYKPWLSTNRPIHNIIYYKIQSVNLGITYPQKMYHTCTKAIILVFLFPNSDHTRLFAETIVPVDDGFITHDAHTTYNNLSIKYSLRPP